MTLPFAPPVEPMLAKSEDDLPEGGNWLYEPKWDGFRALVFKDGATFYTQSRERKPLDRYFPELAAPFATLPERCVLDGEIVIAGPRGLEFESLLLRIHPAASRVKLLAAETPASYVAFDLLALGDEDLRARPFAERRAMLEAALGGVTPPLHLTPMTRDRAVAADWFARFEGAGLDGVMAKPADGAYLPGKRAMVKVKHQRTADCVVAGFRWHKNGPGTHVGSLLLGLYDEAGTLHHVGIASSFAMKRQQELLAELAPLRENALDGHPWRDWKDWAEENARDSRSEPGGRRPTALPAAGGGEVPRGSVQRVPGATSRWNRGKDLSWEPLRIERVAEVAYDHLQGTRFRHGTHLVRWRTDRTPASCTYSQLEATAPFELQRIFAPAHGS